MKDLIQKILEYLPRYLTDFGSLISGPKQFIAQKHTEAEESLGQSLLFLGVSLVLVVVMTAPLLPPGTDLWTHVGIRAVAFLLTVSLSAISLRLAWRLVGGKATLRRFFVIYAYFFGVLVVVLTVFYLLGEGVFKVYAPDLYAQVIEARLKNQAMPDLSGSLVPFVTLFIYVAGFFFMFVWFLVAWGAYRELNGLSKGRSFVALMITVVFSWVIGAVVFFIGSAMIVD